MCNAGLVCGSNFCVRLSGSDGAAGGGGGQMVGTGAGGSGGDQSTGAGGSGGDQTTGAGGTSGGGAGGSPGANLITNGDFSDSTSPGTAVMWLVSQGSPSTTVGNGQFCMMVGPGQFPVLGWPADATSAAQLSVGTTYVFSYSASASTSLQQFVVKVGQAVQPYAADFTATDTLTPSSQRFSHSFVPAMPDATAGVAFEVTAGGQASNVCISNVTLVAQ
jgi:hypothetical protein